MAKLYEYLGKNIQSGSTLKGYVNGQEVINVTNSLDLTINANLVIGYENGLSMN